MKKDEFTFNLSRRQMHAYIRGGRNAIEYSMLLVMIRPRSLTEADGAELNELKALLRKYNELMVKYEFQPELEAKGGASHGANK